MSSENETETATQTPCPRCDGCGQLANSDDREPWSVWLALPLESAVAVTMGLVKPEPCDECGGTGKVAIQPADEGCLGTQRATGPPRRCPSCTQPAGEHHTPIDDWPEIEGTFDEVLERAAQARLGDGEHHTGTLNLTGEGNAPQDTLAALDDEIARTYGGIWAPDNLAEILTKHGWAKASETRQQVAEEIATGAHEVAEQYQATAVTQRDMAIESGRNTPKGQSHMRTAHAYRNKADGAWAVAHAAHEIGGAE